MSWFSQDDAEFIEQYQRLTASRESYRQRLEHTELSLEAACAEARRRGLVLPAPHDIKEDGLHATP